MMKRTVYASDKVAHINFKEELNAQSIETVCKRHGLKYDLDDMYNIDIYAEDEDPAEIEEWSPVATLED